MEFGKLSHIEAVDFTLPADHPGIVKVLGQQKAAHCKVHVGCPIWAGEGFVGKIYPLKAQRKDYLKLYAKHFNSIELNVSHYKQPDTEQIQRWADMTSSDFIFCPKINQTISHTPILIQNVTMMKDFLNQQKAFHEKLGMPFFQLPNSYDSSKLNDLLDFFDQVAMSGFAVELRHESWFSNEAILKQVCNYFYKNNTTSQLADAGARTEFLLPDNSTVLLNAGSSAEFKANKWNDEREVELNGEGYFKVAKGKTFDVKTVLGTVTVIGTQFNVKARDNRFEVTCYEGKVKVTYKSEVVYLLPGNSVAFENGKSIAIAGDNRQQPGWLTFEAAFTAEKPENILQEIERQYNIDIEMAAKPEGKLFTGTLPMDNLDTALEIFGTVYHLKPEKRGNKIILSSE